MVRIVERDRCLFGLANGGLADEAEEVVAGAEDFVADDVLLGHPLVARAALLVAIAGRLVRGRPQDAGLRRRRRGLRCWGGGSDNVVCRQRGTSGTYRSGASYERRTSQMVGDL